MLLFFSSIHVLICCLNLLRLLGIHRRMDSSQRFYLYLDLLLLLLLSSWNFTGTTSSSSSSPSSITAHYLDEAAALLQFKRSFYINSSALGSCGEHGLYKAYPKTKSWKEGTSCCSWEGVTCDNTTHHVVGLDLSCSQLSGTFPPNSSLFNLPYLRTLNLAYNDFHNSKISPKFSDLSRLMHLNLSSSSFYGEVPSETSHLHNLVSLDLSGNAQQTMEKEAFKGLVHNLSRIRDLFLDGVNLSSTDPRLLSNLSSSLRSLGLSSCSLEGSFPQSILSLPQLEYVQLGDNSQLRGHLPVFNQSVPLEHFDLSFTSFSGELPDSIGRQKSLIVLDLSECNFSGPLPMSLGNLSQLSELVLQINYFSGQIPSSLTYLTQLYGFFIGVNQLTGSIPDKASFPNLAFLSLVDNHLSGTIPAWVYGLPELFVLDLSHNQLSGNIHDFRSKHLGSIDLKENKLEGSVPSSIFTLKNLYNLDLSSNNLSGLLELDMLSELQNLVLLDLSSLSLSFKQSANFTLPELQIFSMSSSNISDFPSFLSGSTHLVQLDLSSNRISHIPAWMFNVGKDSLLFLDLSYNSIVDIDQLPWKNLRSFDIRSNLLRGVLPRLPSAIRFLLVSNNSLTGEISTSVCRLTDLEVLDLSQNKFTGTIPNCLISSAKQLSVLDLGRNSFNGTIPAAFPTSCQLENLSLNDNRLVGKLPRSISHCKGLNVLNVGTNQLSDSFPSWVETLAELSVLDLGRNSFNGMIPAAFPTSCQLENLSLNDNRFVGKLPRSISHCKGLKVLNVGTNQLSDAFPRWVETLAELQVLILRSNKFHGLLRTTRHKHPFPKLQILDLSNNRFLGPIPKWYLKSIMELDQRKLSSPQYMHGRYYDYSVGLTIKGLWIQLEKVLTVFTCIDLSCNKLTGEIPEGIGMLGALKGLNLSHNKLSAGIPASFGNLRNLEWLDLCSNKLTGGIPVELTKLTFLSDLNLASNRLTGPIPHGGQFNTFPNDSYAGNDGLCGFPLSEECSNGEGQAGVLQQEEDDWMRQGVIEWKAIVMGYGSGLPLGISIAYIVFHNGNPDWFLKLVGLCQRPISGRRRF